jgi:cell division septal protein FtsQ
MALKSNYSHRKKGRKPPKGGRKLLRFIEYFVCFGIIGVFGYFSYQYTTQSDKFLVKHVQIEGIRYLDEDLVLAESGLMNHGNVLYLHVREVKEAVEAIPYVQECQVTQVFPDTVILNITERVPIMSLQMNSRLYEIDEFGVVLREYSNQEVPIAPIVSNVGGLNFVDKGEAMGVLALEHAIHLWQVFIELPIAKDVKVSEISASSTNELVMYCEELVYELRWGNGDIEEQAIRLGVLWEEMAGALPCTEYLDLRFEDDLTCK